MTMLDLFTGGALSNFSVFSLGIMPYITASIIMQLMQGVIPAVGRWARGRGDGPSQDHAGDPLPDAGPRPHQRGRLPAAVQVAGLRCAVLHGGARGAHRTSSSCSRSSPGPRFIMWMGELITQRGIGNGMSLIIFVSIVSRVPSAIFSSANADDRSAARASPSPSLIHGRGARLHPAHHLRRARPAPHSGQLRQARRRAAR